MARPKSQESNTRRIESKMPNKEVEEILREAERQGLTQFAYIRVLIRKGRIFELAQKLEETTWKKQK